MVFRIYPAPGPAIFRLPAIFPRAFADREKEKLASSFPLGKSRSLGRQKWSRTEKLAAGPPQQLDFSSRPTWTPDQSDLPNSHERSSCINKRNIVLYRQQSHLVGTLLSICAYFYPIFFFDSTGELFLVKFINSTLFPLLSFTCQTRPDRPIEVTNESTSRVRM